jgi:hypothetical protein
MAANSIGGVDQPLGQALIAELGGSEMCGGEVID